MKMWYVYERKAGGEKEGKLSAAVACMKGNEVKE